ncbi:TetR/AcrR family transcriptional regulator [Actinacidiphila acididurans]|uniref:TetR family transcriptional regulator n=1 Tax=Actinacidiphila acididurans TaxID=2784346 RepID=A0ABS2U166_9ACTN|nr:TetR/AcrR family transcriptional regulator [Actinacidiphila acididurans]MBM9508466.1 TetR family transcriptional regulator [Actinacidiphila acididurans]
MARWEPNAQERLLHAAVDLFVEQGYDATTVNEIADRAGLTKTTFFRHFRDKREVLFAGQDLHTGLLNDAVAAVPASATPLEAVGAALDALTAFWADDRREFSAKLRPVIAGHTELQERAALKRAKLTDALTGALHQRGVPEPTAGLAAELGIRAFYQAFDQWVAPANGQSLTALTRDTFSTLRAALTTLT